MKKTNTKVGLLFDFIILIGVVLIISQYKPNTKISKNFLHRYKHSIQPDGVLFNPFVDSITTEKYTINEQ